MREHDFVESRHGKPCFALCQKPNQGLFLEPACGRGWDLNDQTNPILQRTCNDNAAKLRRRLLNHVTVSGCIGSSFEDESPSSAQPCRRRQGFGSCGFQRCTEFGNLRGRRGRLAEEDFPAAENNQCQRDGQREKNHSDHLNNL